MMNKGIFFLGFSILASFLFFSCLRKSSTKHKEIFEGTIKDSSINMASGFKNFLKKFRPLTLPLKINTFDISVDSLNQLSSGDNEFLKSKETESMYCYGLLPDTVDSFKIIWLEPAESEIPVLTTFTKNGKKINEEQLSLGECGSDCGFDCNEFISISKDLRIVSKDSIKSTDCDTNGNFISNTTKKYIRYKNGRILSSGKIKMSPVLEQILD